MRGRSVSGTAVEVVAVVAAIERRRDLCDDAEYNKLGHTVTTFLPLHDLVAQ